MKIEFENEQEKECLKHILLDWFTHNGDDDVLGCEPTCRDASSPGCNWCINNTLNRQIDKWKEIRFQTFGGSEWIMKHGIDKWAAELQLR